MVMLNQVRERLKEVEFLTEAIKLGNRVKRHREEFCDYGTYSGKYFTAENMISLYSNGIDAYEYLQNLFYERLGDSPRDWRNDIYGKPLWEDVKAFVKDHDGC